MTSSKKRHAGRLQLFLLRRPVTPDGFAYCMGIDAQDVPHFGPVGTAAIWTDHDTASAALAIARKAVPQTHLVCCVGGD